MGATSSGISMGYGALAVCVAAAAAIPKAPAAENKAQTSEQQTTLGEIVVTAQYRQQNLQDTPIAITAGPPGKDEERSAPQLAGNPKFPASVGLRAEPGTVC